MLFDVVRRLSAILLTLSLVLGPGVNSVHASSMGAKMAVGAWSDTRSPGKCDDCGGNKAGMAVGTCSVNCSGVTAVPPGMAVADRLTAETHGNVATPGMAGHHIAPDPYPPRPAVLS